MNSINKNQPEDNHENLTHGQAVEKIKELAEKSGTCFFCTAGNESADMGARPMSVQKVDAEGQLWFLGASDSGLVKEVEMNSTVHLYFQVSEHSGFMHLVGHASISKDESKIKEFWKPVLKTWFTEGENDPRIRVVKVSPTDGYYWDNKHGNFVAGVKMLAGALMGKTLDDSVEGKLKA